MPHIVTWAGEETLIEIDKLLSEGKAFIVDGMPNGYYHNHKSISSSGLRTIITQCPKKFWYKSPFNPNRPQQEQKKHFSIGQGAHDYLLQRDAFLELNSVLPVDFNPYTKAGKDMKAELISQGLNVIKYDEFEQIKEMVAEIDAHPFAGAAFTDGKAERSLFWVDKKTGVYCRCRPDWLPYDAKNVPDYKTTADASQEGVDKSMANFGYNMQHAWYSDGIKAVFGKAPEQFFFVYQEKEAPYIVTCAVPDSDAIRYGAMLNRKALGIFAECLKTDTWPGYSDRVIVSRLPVWKSMQLDMQEQEGTLESLEA